MRSPLKHLLVAGLLAAPLAACDLDQGLFDDDGFGDTTNDQGGNTDVGEEDPFGPTGPTAVYIQDEWDGVCRSTSNSNGADIDAVELVLGDTHQSYFLGTVIGQVGHNVGTNAGSGCANDYRDINQAKGPPDATKLVPPDGTQFVSLHGGWIAGTFTSQPVIMDGDSLVIHEIGTNFGGNANSDEKVTVYVMTDLACPGPNSSCAHKVGTATGQATIDIRSLPF